MVYSRPSLLVSTAAIGTQEDVNHWPHLKGIDLPRIEAEIGLISSDVPQAMQPKEVRESKNRGPFAMRTVLGWMLSGPLGRKETKVPMSNIIATTANLSKQFEDFYATKGGEKKQKRRTFCYAYRSGMDAQWTLRTKRD